MFTPIALSAYPRRLLNQFCAASGQHKRPFEADAAWSPAAISLSALPLEILKLIRAELDRRTLLNLDEVIQSSNHIVVRTTVAYKTLYYTWGERRYLMLKDKLLSIHQQLIPQIRHISQNEETWTGTLKTAIPIVQYQLYARGNRLLLLMRKNNPVFINLQTHYQQALISIFTKAWQSLVNSNVYQAQPKLAYKILRFLSNLSNCMPSSVKVPVFYGPTDQLISTLHPLKGLASNAPYLILTLIIQRVDVERAAEVMTRLFDFSANTGELIDSLKRTESIERDGYRIGDTPLELAFRAHCFKLMLDMYKLGADVNEAYNGMPISTEIVYGRLLTAHQETSTRYIQTKLDVLDYLLSQPELKINRKNYVGCTALHNAIKGGEVEIVTRLLADARTDVNLIDQEGQTALAMAIQLYKRGYDKENYKKLIVLLLNDARLDRAVLDQTGQNIANCATAILNC